MNALDRAIVRATQGGIPLEPRPYAAIAERVGLTERRLIEKLSVMLADGVIRRIGAVPNHYALGYTANAMSVWDVEDDRVRELGAAVGALPFVSHCYRRPRRLPGWRYNLFAMVHGRDREETARKAAAIRDLLGAHARAFELLYSVRILKKTGLRLA